MNKALSTALAIYLVAINAVAAPILPPPKPKPIPKTSFNALQHRVATTKFDGKTPGLADLKNWTADFKFRFGLDKQKTCKYSREILVKWLDNQEGVVDSPDWSNCDLSRINLSKKLVNNATINRTNLDETKIGIFRNSQGFAPTFYRANLSAADLSGSQWRLPLLQSSALHGSKWAGSDIRGYLISDSSGAVNIAATTLKNGFIDKSVLISPACNEKPPKLALCPGSTAQRSTIDGLVADNSNLTGFNFLSARSKNVLIKRSNVSGVAPSDAVEAKNFRIRESFRNYISYRNGRPYEMLQQDIGWGSDAYWNF